MTEVTYNQFRGLHKGTPQKKVSKLWKKYKDGKYKLPAVEGQDFVTVNEGELYIIPPDAPAAEEVEEVVEEVVEVVIEEPTPQPKAEETEEENIGELCTEYMRLQKKLKLLGPRLSEGDYQVGLDRLQEIATKTIPKEYTCTPTDSWKLWFGPTSKSQMAFEITREWWQIHYQNTIYVDRELLNNNDLIDMEIRRYFRLGRFLPRTPVVGVECKLPQGVKDIQIRGGQGTN
mgnify:FL=1